MTDGEREWYVWEAPGGLVELADGRRVEVTGGDRLLGQETPDGLIFFRYEPGTKH